MRPKKGGNNGGRHLFRAAGDMGQSIKRYSLFTAWTFDICQNLVEKTRYETLSRWKIEMP